MTSVTYIKSKNSTYIYFKLNYIYFILNYIYFILNYIYFIMMIDILKQNTTNMTAPDVFFFTYNSQVLGHSVSRRDIGFKVQRRHV